MDPLGDLSALKKIISDAATIAATGDFAAAEKRITDYETARDDAAGTMRAMDSNAWGNVDTGIRPCPCGAEGVVA